MSYRQFAPPTFEYDLAGVRSHIDLARDAAMEVIFELDRGIPSRQSGIYFLIDRRRDEVVYIGVAVDIAQRWKGHRLRNLLLDGRHFLAWKPLDDEYFCNKEHEEAYYIALLRPRYNTATRFRTYPEWWKK